jgi:hypothetical protein
VRSPHAVIRWVLAIFRRSTADKLCGATNSGLAEGSKPTPLSREGDGCGVLCYPCWLPLRELVEVGAEAMQPEHVDLWLRPDSAAERDGHAREERGKGPSGTDRRDTAASIRFRSPPS